MKKIYVLILLNLGLNLRSQNFNWANRAGLWEYDYGYGIVNDNAGNVYVAGKYEQNADFSGIILPCQNNHDIFLAKYNSTGAIEWVQTGGGTLGDYAHAVACDGSNYVYVAGEIEGCNNPIVFPGSSITLNCVCGNDVFLTKYDLNGNLLWARSAGGNYNDKAVGVTYDNAGNIFICGLFTDTATFGGTTTIYGHGVEDIFVAKYDMNGVFQWVQNAGSADRDEPKSIICDAQGNVYVCGFYSNGTVFGSQTLSTVSGTYFDTFLAKYTTNGTLLWVKTDGGAYDDVAWSMTMDNAGLIYISGEFNASAMFGSTQLITSGNSDVYVACYDLSGNVQWAKGAGGTDIDRARGIGCDGTNIYITGQFGTMANFGSTTLNAADGSDIFFASLNNSGNFIGALSVGGIADSATEVLGYESGIAICAEPSGAVYATGSTLNGGVFGSTTLMPYTRTDVFVTKIDQLSGIYSPSSATENVSVYPNPSKGEFTIGFDQPVNQKAELCVYNCFGQLLDKKKDVSTSKIEVNLTAQESGIYFVELKLENKSTLRKKVVIQK